MTKEFHDFGEGEPIPCKTIDLTDPIIVIESSEKRAKSTVEEKTTEENEKEKSASSTGGGQTQNHGKERTGKSTVKSTTILKSSATTNIPKAENGFVKGLKAVGRFIVNHPVESIEIAGTVIVGGIELVSVVAGSRNKSGGTSTSSPGGSGTISTPKTDIAAKVADIVEKATRAENDVSGHKQRYHIKDGVVWKDKAPYHRGGKDS